MNFFKNVREFADDEQKNILAVDDSPENIEIIKQSLTPEYQVKAAVRGELALEIARQQRVDLILLDIRMPGMDGYEVCQRLKEDPDTAQIPIIFLTGQDTMSDEALGLQMGAVDFIIKPINPPILKARLQTHLALNSARKKLEKHNNYLEELVEEKVAEIADSRMALIYALARLAESRDEETGEHLIRTQKYCWLLVNKLKEKGGYCQEINDSYCKNISIATPLHDIGKVGIPDSILLKPGKLSAEEFERVKNHTLIGYDIIEEIQQMYADNTLLQVGANIVLYHHEKWNGSGYPEGLSGQDIPLEARIMAIADVYDALRSERPYKDAFSPAKSSKIIQEDRGSHFDPLLVDCFLELESEFAKISSEKETMVNFSQEITLIGS